MSTFSNNSGIYSVDLMYRYVNNNKITSKKIKPPYKAMKTKTWGSPWDGVQYSPLDILNNKHLSIEDYNRILHADLRYPMFMDNQHTIIDGRHRLGKAYKEKKKTIRAYVFSKPLMDKFRLSTNITEKEFQKIDKLTQADYDKLYAERFQ